jgi:tetratricopeptide (TPR) repeat protein
MWVFLEMRIFLCILSVIVFFSCNNPKGTNTATDKTSVYPVVVKDLMQAINRFPDSAELRVQLIDTMDSLNLTKEALSQIDSLITKDPANYGVWFRKGELAIKIADTALAIQSFATASKIYSNPDVVLTIANLYAAQKNKLALELCNTIIEQKPDRTYIAHSYYIMGLYFGNTGNTKNAIDNFNNCIQNNYFYIDAYLEIGWIYVDQQKFEKAKEIFETATAVKPTDARGHYWAAKCLEKLGQSDKAINAYQLAFNLDNSLSEAAEAISRIKAAKK